MQNSSTSQLYDKLNQFIKKYYANQLIKGGIYSFAVLFIFFIIFSVFEYFSRLNVGGRTFMFWLYLSINAIIAAKYLITPLLKLLQIRKGISYKQAANIIGTHFSSVDDKLLNILELEEMSEKQNTLINASINQKIDALGTIKFSNAINFNENKKHIKWVLIPIAIILLFILTGKQYILTESSARIMQHNTFFEPKAPFNYHVNTELEVIQFNDYTLNISLSGNEIPTEVFIEINNNSFRLKKINDLAFEYEFKAVNNNISFNLKAGGYKSEPYLLKALPQPKVVNFNCTINYPNYTKIKDETLNNSGDLIVPQGSKVNWVISLKNTQIATLKFNDESYSEPTKENISFSKQFFKNTPYHIIIQNEYALSDTLSFFIKVIPDNFPTIILNQEYDTSNTQFLFNGEIEDDYALKRLTFNYQNNNQDNNELISEEIKIKEYTKEFFFYTIDFSTVNTQPGDAIDYYFEVWDNDAINGSKSTKSKVFTYKEATKEELIDKKDAENDKTKSGINKSISLANALKKDIEELNKSILEKEKIGWEEKEKAKEILKKQKELQQQIKATQKRNSDNLKNQEKLNSSILEKQKQLEDLMNKVLDEETKKLLKEMEKMMDKVDKEKLKELLDKLDDENSDLEKELDRELELFKQLEFEQKTDEILEKIAELKKEQEALKDATKEGEKTKEELSKQQEKLQEKAKDLQKDLNDLKQKNKELEQKNKMPDTKSGEENLKQKMQESKDALEKGKQKKAAKAQEEAIEELENIEQELQKMQEESSESQPEEDMEALRQILENLVQLSFDQESLLQQTRRTPKNSSEFVKIVQQQNKLADDSKIIEDSLFALSKRVVQLQSTINKEIASINSNMHKATEELEQREIGKANERQQFVMTATNNLALLLSEILEQMQKDLANQTPGKKQCNKPKNCKKPSMSQLKKAQKKLNKEMKKGKKKGKKGENKKKKGEEKGDAKGLMQLAKQQESIRRQLMELKNEMGENGNKGKLDKLLDDMEKNETDIINNRITQETINRQEDILSKLLEAEQAQREQDEDNKRKSTEWLYKTDDNNKQFIEYQKQKMQQEELLKTTPIQLKPYYKKKVNTYFNSIIKEEK